MSNNISIITIQKIIDIPILEINAPFVCLIYSDQETTSEEMMKVTEWLISSECRYAVCAGKDCETWHDAIDSADILFEHNSDELVMTSWHEKETIDEVVWFWLNLTNFDDITFENYLALIISDSKVIEEEIQKAIKNNNL
jgi:hypothetical protein